MITQERIDIDKAKAVALGSAIGTFITALAAAQTSCGTANTTTQADGGAAGGTKTAVSSANTLVQALSASAIAALSTY